jgi:hypothetical protein
MSSQIVVTPDSITDLLKSVSIHVSGAGKYEKFKRLYKNDRIAFVYDILPSLAKTIAPYQEEILGYFDEGHNRVAVRSPHGVGKTALASVLTHHSVLTAEFDCKVPTTASAWRQLEKYLWPEIRKTGKFLDWIEIGREIYTRLEFLQLSIRLSGGIVEAFAVASDDHTTIEGAHATRMVYIFDEAKSIPRNTWDAAEGAFSSEGLNVSDYELGIIPTILGVDEDISVPTSLVDVVSKSAIVDGIGVVVGGSNRAYPKALVPQTQSYSPKAVVPQAQRNSFNPPPLAPRASSEVPITSVEVSEKSILATHVSPGIERTSISRAPDPDIYTYEAMAFAISTPGDPSGQFYDIHMHKQGYEDWLTRHVTLDEGIRAGRVSPSWAEKRKRQWGQDSPVYQNRVLGEFADFSDDGIIPLLWVRASNERWHVLNLKQFAGVNGIKTLGIDVAREGEDKTVVAVRNGPAVAKLHTYSKLPTTSTAGHIKSLARDHFINIEIDGIGAGVYDILREQEVPKLRPITVSGTSYFRDRSKELSFGNVRAAMWWNMRELLDPAYRGDIALPPVEELILDLTTPRYLMKKDATVYLEDRRSIMARLGRSPDYGTAVCLAFWNTSTGGGVIF